jgi:lipopolysaccharide/colanic/teichoic acid biosynthesis glycosyltransferase
VTRFHFLTLPVNVSHKIENVAAFCLASVLLLAYAPLIGFIALAIYIDSAEPVLLRQTLKVAGRPDVISFVFRTGRRSGNGRPTRFGTFLRSSGLDRLPRLLNILWGGKPLAGSRATPADPVSIRQHDRKIPPSPEQD